MNPVRKMEAYTKGLKVKLAESIYYQHEKGSKSSKFIYKQGKLWSMLSLNAMFLLSIQKQKC